MLLVLLLLVGGAGRAQAESPAVPAAPTMTQAWVARVVTPIEALRQPGTGSLVMNVPTQARWNGGPVGLLVLDTATLADGSLWLRVRLPIRPNGTSGWIPADETELSPTPYRIEILTRQRIVRFLETGRVMHRFRAVVGAPRWPTPHGLFAVSERVAQPNPRGFLGTWALHLTAFSNTLINFGGGPGTIAIHGRGGASLLDPLGSARSHGCIRITNRAVDYIEARAEEGTPVVIR